MKFSFCLFHIFRYRQKRQNKIKCNVMNIFIITPPWNREWGIFSLQFICVSICLSVCLSVCPAEFLWTKFQLNGCKDLDAVFAKWLLITLAGTLLKLVTLGQRSRSLWQKMYLKLMKKIAKNSTINIFENKPYCLREHFIAVILIPNMTILYNKY